MQALFNLIAGLLSALAALAFAQFGVSLHGTCKAHSKPAEIHRTVHPGRAAGNTADAIAPAGRQGYRA
jgi:hypothetical protein